MVALVCALGAYSESYVLDQNAQSHTPVRSSNEHEAAVAYRYWNVAVKRLGLAIGQNSLEAVQCLCLTGIWYMNNMQPLQGWKHFALASNAWYTATIPRVASTTGGNEMSGDELLAIEQRLYFTCFKSEGELAFELSLPRSILESFEYQHTFPSPPPLDQQPGVGERHEPERRGWYYYLAEIACRHVTNRITDVQRNRMPDPTTQGIEAMFEELEMFETQLNHWYDSLPTSVKFPLPVGDIRPLDDELSQLLRARYLGIREMCYRPFVQLAVNYHLDLQPDLLTKVAAIVSQGLKYCLFRIQAVPPQWRHHGLWFQLPNSTTCALVLIAADRAQHDPALNTFRQIQLPSGWYLQILATRDLLARYWDNRRGGIWDCFRILDWALDS
ncbi:hypothetical protein IFR05_013151 [Cadophora sp. M221]|nr:hypothetical protein IFR05_013151 [Cadophora sp. M221]